MFCHHCGTEIQSGGAFCPSCGKNVAGGPGGQWTPKAVIEVRTGHWIGRGWELVKADMFVFAVMTILYAVIVSAGAFVVQGAMAAGFQIVFMRKLQGRPVTMSNLFDGFSFFLPTLLAHLVIAVFTFAGLVACIVPALVITAMYQFTNLFIFDKNMDFWTAMKASHALVERDYFGFTVFLIAIVLVNLLGLLCCVVGLLWTVPLTYAAVTVAYQETVGFEAIPD